VRTIQKATFLILTALAAGSQHGYGILTDVTGISNGVRRWAQRPAPTVEVHAQILPVDIGAPIAAIVWLALAWANGRGYGWARGLFVGLLGRTSLSLLAAFGQHVATYAPADLIARLFCGWPACSRCC
jgi:hypothetical protein